MQSLIAPSPPCLSTTGRPTRRTRRASSASHSRCCAPAGLAVPSARARRLTATSMCASSIRTCSGCGAGTRR
eukprot:5398666-Prymnesium_polylepis.2